MAVRRLHSEQPPGFAFSPENAAWAERTIGRYPEGRQASAVIPLLWKAQEQDGWVSERTIESVADMLAMPKIRVLEVATFYTMFQLSPVGTKAHVQVCGTTPCMLRGAGDLIDICRRRIAHEPHQLSADGAFSWEEVECLGACVNAPMVQVFKDTYEDLTAESFGALLDAFAAGGTPRPGPQTDRRMSAPLGGPTTLTTLDYDGMERAFAERGRRNGGVSRSASSEPPPSEPSPPAAANVPDAAADPGGGLPLSAKPVRLAEEAERTEGDQAAAAPEGAQQEAAKPTGTGRPDEEAARSRPTDGGDQGLGSLPHKRTTAERAADAAAASDGAATTEAGGLDDLSRAGREHAVGGGAPGFSPATGGEGEHKEPDDPLSGKRDPGAPAAFEEAAPAGAVRGDGKGTRGE